MHRKAMQAAEDERKKVERKALARARPARPGSAPAAGSGNVVEKLFGAIAEGWESATAHNPPAPKLSAPQGRAASPAKPSNRRSPAASKGGKSKDARPSPRMNRRPPSSEGRWRTPSAGPLMSPLRLSLPEGADTTDSGAPTPNLLSNGASTYPDSTPQRW